MGKLLSPHEDNLDWIHVRGIVAVHDFGRLGIFRVSKTRFFLHWRKLNVRRPQLIWSISIGLQLRQGQYHFDRLARKIWGAHDSETQAVVANLLECVQTMRPSAHFMLPGVTEAPSCNPTYGVGIECGTYFASEACKIHLTHCSWRSLLRWMITTPPQKKNKKKQEYPICLDNENVMKCDLTHSTWQ